jgi:hypothetical protein
VELLPVADAAAAVPAAAVSAAAVSAAAVSTARPVSLAAVAECHSANVAFARAVLTAGLGCSFLFICRAHAS